ncbi:hypothetical protein OTSANNIE_1634 [Anaplasma phagocytophilum str. Annie]|nr:hypothetical protein OTSANNIE_1634 [Anaplasma phagocytophilum str. Annie]
MRASALPFYVITSSRTQEKHCKNSWAGIATNSTKANVSYIKPQ